MATKITIDTKIADKLIRDMKEVGKTKYIIHDGVEYGSYQEFGTSRMDKNPALVPAFVRLTKKLPQLLKAGFDKGIPGDAIIRKLAFDIATLWAKNVRVDTGTLKNSITVSEERI